GSFAAPARSPFGLMQSPRQICRSPHRRSPVCRGTAAAHYSSVRKVSPPIAAPSVRRATWDPRSSTARASTYSGFAASARFDIAGPISSPLQNAELPPRRVFATPTPALNYFAQLNFRQIAAQASAPARLPGDYLATPAPFPGQNDSP